MRSSAASATAVASSGADAGKPMPGAENAGKPGYYTIRPGDTLIRIGLEQGQHWKDIVKWNNMDNPNLIEVGQVIRVAPPSADVASNGAKPVTVAKVEARPLDAKMPAAVASAAPGTAANASTVSSAPSAASSPAVTAPVPVATAPAVAPPAPVSATVSRDPEEDLGWQWPATGTVLSQFDEGKTKGLAISGKAGDPVVAAADGRVVYAGSGLRGYGNLVIVKHNSTYLTAYAHNQTLLVKEDQPVRKGQRIAEMGSSDAERVQLHFEIRKQGKPIDPAKLLPPR